MLELSCINSHAYHSNDIKKWDRRDVAYFEQNANTLSRKLAGTSFPMSVLVRNFTPSASISLTRRSTTNLSNFIVGMPYLKSKLRLTFATLRFPILHLENSLTTFFMRGGSTSAAIEGSRPRCSAKFFSISSFDRRTPIVQLCIQSTTQQLSQRRYHSNPGRNNLFFLLCWPG